MIYTLMPQWFLGIRQLEQLYILMYKLIPCAKVCSETFSLSVSLKTLVQISADWKMSIQLPTPSHQVLRRVRHTLQC